MSFDFSGVDAVLQSAVGVDTPAAQLVVRKNGTILFHKAYGFIDPDQRLKPVDQNTLFDMASVTKLFTTTCFMRMVEAGLVSVDQPVSEVLPEFSGQRPIHPYENPLRWSEWVDVSQEKDVFVDAGKITFRQILTHSSGLPAWRLFKDQPDAQAARQLALDTFFSYLPGTKIVYSDVGLILLGMALEKLGGQRLDEVIYGWVTRPLGLENTYYLPLGEQVLGVDRENIAPTEFCGWRNRRVVGEVHDESTANMDGIAGHAGIFSTASDVSVLGQMYIDQGGGLLTPDTVAEMVRVQAEYEGTRRGLGFALWSSDSEASSNPFHCSAFGHTGFTGTCLWMDPSRNLVAAFLTNEVYNGRESRAIMPLRVKVHQAIVSAVDAAK